jgi:hypothetical protein
MSSITYLYLFISPSILLFFPVTRLQAGRQRFDSRQGRIFLFATTSLGPTQPLTQWVPVLSSGVQRLGREAKHSPPSSAEVKNAWSYTSTPSYVCVTWYLVMHQRQLYFTLFSSNILILHVFCRKYTVILSRLWYECSYSRKNKNNNIRIWKQKKISTLLST